MSGSLPIAVTRMTFDDEFNSFVSSANGSAGWMTTLPYGGEAAYTLAGNNEAEYYGSSTSGLNPFSLNSGVLSITATAAGGSNPYGLPYNSGLITTDTSFSQTYGYFEVNAELPAGQGLWPAFWLLPASNAYTSELDVFEQLGDAPSTIYSTVHGATNGVWASDSQAFTVADTSTGFHTYGVDWEPTTTTYYIDGVAIGSAPTPASMNSPMFMLLNLAVGGAGSWPGAASASAIPAALKIDDVRVYATAATNFVGGTAAIAPGAATQTLTVVVAEDTLAGDAQFQIVVNGVAVGGVLTTQSLHALGQQDTLTFNGTWNTGSNTVSVDYLNAAAGRALYVESVTLDGVAAPTASVALTADGTTGFVVPMAATLIGSGSDTLALTVSEDAYLGNAQFTVSINGVQQGGMLTATAADATPYTPLPAQSQVFDFKGSFTGAEVVTVSFLNDAYGGSAAADRNLFVLGATIDGTAIAGSTLFETAGGPQTFSFAAVAPVVTAPGPTIVGSGSDTLALTVSEDAYLGNAQFTVSINGVQQGGTLTATSTDATPYTPLLAQSQVFDFKGSFTGSEIVTVNFLNDLYGGSGAADRNLFVLGATIDGTAIAGSTLTEDAGGAQSFAFTAAAPAVVAPTTPAATIVGAGPDTLALTVSEDAYLGNAQFTVSVDGVQQGGTLTATATNVTPYVTASAQSQVFAISGTFAPGSHVVSVDFLNNAYGGSAATDRNLYVQGASIDGTAISGSVLNEVSAGPQSFSFTEPVVPITPATTAGAGLAATLMLNLSEDAYLGDAQFTVAVDGVKLAAAQAVTTLHSSGGFESFGFADVLATGTHDVAVSFLNDAYGGTSSMDRNLYVNGASVNGVAVTGAASNLFSAGTNHFSISVN